MNKICRQDNVDMYVWMDGWTDGRTDGWKGKGRREKLSEG